MREVYSCPELHLGRREAELVRRAERRGAAVCELGPTAFASVSGRARPDGLLAVVALPPTRLDAVRVPAQPLVVVADGIERPGNLGSIVRSACAAGADAMLLCDCPTDAFHPDAVRGAVGTVLHVQLADASASESLAWLRERRIPVVVAAPGARRPYWQVDWRRGAAIVLGSERHGARDEWLAAADAVVSIPMAGAADSLNVAVAAGVVLFEAARARAADPPSARNGGRRRARRRGIVQTA